MPDLTLVKKVLNWEPVIGLELGMDMTYQWIAKQVKAK